MTDERRLRQEIESDLQEAGRRVVYLEGRLDPPIFFALLGVAVPADSVHDGVLVKGLDAKGSGNSAVRARLEVADKYGYRGVYGIVDGDGTPQRELRMSFDRPYGGPLFAWPTYSIENMLVRAGWPDAWGATPDWPKIFKEFGPYVALNTLHREIRDILVTLELHQYSGPILRQPRKNADDVLAALEKDKHLIAGVDVAERFTAELARFNALVDASVDDGHALVNGKWLVDVIAAERSRLAPERCREVYTQHIATQGGHPEVHGLWQRITHRA